MILVTGGAGYIGSHAVLSLRESGQEVVVLDDLVNGHAAAVLDAPLVQGRLDDRELVRKVLREHRVEAVMHFAARAYVGESVDEPSKYVRDNSIGMWELLEAMRECGVHKFVFSSTCAVYGVPEEVPITEQCRREPISPYGFTKRFCEEMLEAYCHAYGLAAVALRYFNAAGADPGGRIGEWHEPEPHLIPSILRRLASDTLGPLQVFGNDYPTPDGTCVRDYIHVTDLALAHQLALERLEAGKFQTYNLGTGKGTSVLEVIEAAKAVTGKDVPYEVAPRRPGDPPELVAAADKARTALGFQAQHSDIRTIVQHAWNWLQTHPNGYDGAS